MKDCEHCKVDRRAFVKGAAAVSAALAGPFGFVQELLAREAGAKGAKACILLWMSGGPSQMDTWDPKPGTDTGGEFSAIDTAVRGIRIAEPLQNLAREMKRFSIIRNLAQPEGDHDRATYLMHTGYPLLEASPSPAVGSMFSHELVGQQVEFPRYVTIGSSRYGPAFLGYQHAPFAVSDPGSALETIRAVGQGRARLELMDKLQAPYVAAHKGEAREQREAMVRQLARLNDTPFAAGLDLSAEPEEIKKAYGENAFGQGCLLARRLVEHGVKFVEVELGSWDTHSDNFNGVRGLCNDMDPAFATLLKDLDARGLLAETIVLWMGEFGRTPTINVNNGRDHFPDITPVALAGGPIQGGRAIGQTDKTGESIVSTPVRVKDLFATLYQACGIKHNKKFFNREGKLFKTTDGGVPIKDLL
jgi:hypothetical protein